MEKNIKKIRALRQEAIDQLRELYNAAQAAIDNLASRRLFKIRYEDISDIIEDFKQHHTNLIGVLSGVEGADMAIEQRVRENFNQDYYAVKVIFDELFENKVPELLTASVKSNVNLPKIELLIFKGDLRDFTAFKDMFDALVHSNQSLTNIEKFNYLISCLSGPPLTIAKSLPLSNDNYQIVYDNLVARYTNKRLLATSHWREIQNFKKIASRSASSLRRLLDIFRENLNALENLGLPVNQWGFVLLNKMLDKLDDDTVAAFELSLKGTEIPTYDTLIDFVEHQCRALENIAFSSSSIKFKKPENNSTRTNICSFERPNSSVFFTNSETVLICSLCRQSHPLYKCNDFMKKSADARYQFIKNRNLCTNCLSSLHTTRTCKSKSVCRKCNKRHHTLLHFENNTQVSSAIQGSSIQGGPVQTEPSASNSVVETNSALTFPTSTAHSLTGLNPQNTSVLLSTALVELADRSGNYHVFRALIDSGSQTTFISQNCSKKLGLFRSKMSLSVRGLGLMHTSIDSGTISTTCRPVGKSTPLLDVVAVILPKICDALPTTELREHSWSHISNLTLADPTFHIPGDIDILFGADILPQILLNGHVTGNVNEPMGLNTIFGYVLMGKIKANLSPQITALFCAANSEPLDNVLKRFWELESIPNVNAISTDDDFCEKLFLNTTTRDKEGRFIVNLPFRETAPHFKNTRTIALQFLYALERRLIKNTDLYNQYASFMKEYLDLGHMEPVPAPTNSDTNFYMPHSCVLKPQSTSTKLRVVFNASVKLPSCPTLNDTIYVGPKLQKDIVTILLNFRLHKIAFTADIKQMYRQIWINPAQTDYQRILWRFSPEEPIQDFRLKTVTYGISSAPYLALRTLLKLADDEAADFPNAASVLHSDIYVDDIVTGSPSLQHAQNLQAELINLLARGGFELRKWASNEVKLLANLPPSYLADDPHLWDEGNGLKVLGLYWRPSSDVFSYQVAAIEKGCTKRQILSQLAKIFDPLGFLTPITFLTKRVLQRLWYIGLGWDDPPPEDVVNFWTRFREELPLLSRVQVPRRIISNTNLSCQLHGFCDASMHGYCSVVYFLERDDDKLISVNFVCAKSRVAPLRRLSIPRLELCAAVMLADLISFVTKTYRDKINLSGIYAWSDSTIALSWIKSSAHRWQTFVSNRVSYIQERVAPIFWRHVRSSENPADIGSRGVFPSEIIDNSLWWEGSSFLHDPSTSWSTSTDTEILSPEALTEERQITLHAVVSEDLLDSLLNRFSSFSKLQRIFAYSLRFIHNCRNPLSKKLCHLTQEELNHALCMLIKHTQITVFSNDFNQLRKGLKVSKPLRKLGVFLDDLGLLRVGGRLRHSKLTYDRKHPYLLPRCSRLTTLLIEWCHLKYLHAGCQTVQFILAQNFWILSSRRAIRTIISQCHTCWRQRPEPYQPAMSDLPRFRVSQLNAFSHVGVDYGGPFRVTMGKMRGAKTYKAYLCLFVCMSTKALHLELASELTAEAFLAALRRLIARRGRPSHIYSDCGTNFVSANKQLRMLMQSAAAKESLEWHFNPPHAPHFGGLWEAGIKSVKSHLLRVVGQQLLTYEEFYTVLAQTEAILNSRPLTQLSADPHDLLALTPAHFLNMQPLSCLPEKSLMDLPLGRLSRWQLLQRLHQDLWSRWHKEYLHTLIQRSKWTSSTHIAKPGDMVVLKNDQAPPLEWQLGRIVEVFPGADGVVRVATVRTKNGTFKRPLVKLCPLPASPD